MSSVKCLVSLWHTVRHAHLRSVFHYFVICYYIFAFILGFTCFCCISLHCFGKLNNDFKKCMLLLDCCPLQQSPFLMALDWHRQFQLSDRNWDEFSGVLKRFLKNLEFNRNSGNTVCDTANQLTLVTFLKAAMKYFYITWKSRDNPTDNNDPSISVPRSSLFSSVARSLDRFGSFKL